MPLNGPARQIMDGQSSVLVRQRLDPCDCFVCCERRNLYRLAQTPPDWDTGGNWSDQKFYAAPQILTAKEESTCFCRFCCTACRELDLNFTAGDDKNNPNGNRLFSMHRPCKIPFICCVFWECCPHEMTTSSANGDQVGRVVHDFRCCDQICCAKSWWKVENEHQEPQYYIRDNLCCNSNMCAPTCCCPVRRFEIFDQSSQHQVGEMENIFQCSCKRLCFTGADQYRIVFPQDATADNKALLISALMLMEYTMFERGSEGV